MATIEDSQSDDDAAAATDPADDSTQGLNDERPTVSPSDLSGLAVADDHEAAAIAAAIAAHLRDRQAAAAAAAAAADDEAESRRSWAFAGRLEAIGETAGRPPNNTPKNAWSAASRADRF